MDGLAQLLQALDPNQIDQAVSLLQSLREQKENGSTIDVSSDNQAGARDTIAVSEDAREKCAKHETHKNDRNASTASSFPDLRSLEAVATATPNPTERHPKRASKVSGPFDSKRRLKQSRDDGWNAFSEDSIPLAFLSFDEAGEREGSHEHAALESRPTSGKPDGVPSALQAPKSVAVNRNDAASKELSTIADQASSKKVGGWKKKAAPTLAAKSLSSFGFSSRVKKSVSEDKHKLFPSFVQDKRVVPPTLQFWKNAGDSMGASNPMPHPFFLVEDRGDGASFINCVTPEAVEGGLPADEVSSFLHPPLGLGNSNSHVEPVRFSNLNEMVEASHKTTHAALEAVSMVAENHSQVVASHGTLFQNVPDSLPQQQVASLLNKCPCFLHTRVPEPHAGFDNEVIFTGFYAVGYDPCQSRPPYFGTHNHFGEGGLNEKELLQMARFAMGKEMPRLSTLDYEYDSGDDWDVMEGDEDIAVSSSADSDEDGASNSLGSSDTDFINDDDDGSDADCELQRKIMEARQRRMSRLRGRDKLVPSFSGPFCGLPIDEHPLRQYDQLDRMVPLDAAYFDALLIDELANVGAVADIRALGTGGRDDEEAGKAMRQRMQESVLRNRREMTEDELSAMHVVVGMNSKVTTTMVVEALRQQQMCIGVATAEIRRTLKRFYERLHGALVKREVPWSATDERLFTKPTGKKATHFTAQRDAVPLSHPPCVLDGCQANGLMSASADVHDSEKVCLKRSRDEDCGETGGEWGTISVRAEAPLR